MSRKVDEAESKARAPLSDPASVFGAYIADRRLKSTRQRRIILEAFLGANGHVTVDQLLAEARARDPRVSAATLYRTLRLLVECGLARAQQFEGGQTVYERAAGREHHDHLVCTQCGAVGEFEDARIEDLQLSVAKAHGFTVTSHRMELYGLCRRCQKGKKAPRRVVAR